MAHPASSADGHSSPPAHASASAHAHEEHHGSFWPLFLTIATTIFLLGLLRDVRSGFDVHVTDAIEIPTVALLGFAGMAASVVGWVREDVHELRGKPFQEGYSDYFWGAIVLICSEIVLFGILFTFYFWSRAHQGAEFVPENVLHMNLAPIVLNTVLLLSSGGTVHMAQLNLKAGNVRRFRGWLIATITLGTLFVLGQAREYLILTGEGLNPTTSVYATSFFSLTGVHGLHVIAGLVALSSILGLSYTGFITKERATGVEGAFLYWHFVDAIWILVFSFVYLRLLG